MVTFYIDNRKMTAEPGETVLTVARRAGIEIPTLCHHEAVDPSGACRLCVVEITMPSWDGWSKLVTACLYPVAEDLRVLTRSPKVMRARALVLDLLLARCPDAPLIQRLAAEYGVPATTFVPRENPDDCILCGLCVRACDAVGCNAIGTAQRGHRREIATPLGEPPEDCIGCGACAEICPTDFIVMTTEGSKRRIWDREFELLTCRDCGEPFMTPEQRDHLVATQGLDESYYQQCPSCKRQQTADKFADLVLKTHPGFEPKPVGVVPLPNLPVVQPKQAPRR